MSRIEDEKKVLPVVVVGAGLVGSMAGLMLAQRGYAVEIFEARPDYRQHAATADANNSSLHGQLTNTTKRSINLALSHRGLCALRAVGLESEVLKNSVAMEGRMIHPANQTDINKTVFQPYEHR
jgi:kynurenine 3-monooxygenase